MVHKVEHTQKNNKLNGCHESGLGNSIGKEVKQRLKLISNEIKIKHFTGKSNFHSKQPRMHAVNTLRFYTQAIAGIKSTKKSKWPCFVETNMEVRYHLLRIYRLFIFN